MKQKPSISAIILDLDNTLYDWVSFFVPSFYALTRTASEILEIEEDELLNDLQKVHQRHGDTEHPFALLETTAVNRKWGELSFEEKRHKLDPAFYAFNRSRKTKLSLYEGVEETLRYLRQFGIPIVAYTDARIINAQFRVDKLCLQNYIQAIYAPASRHNIDVSKSHEQKYLRLLPPEDRKPNPTALLDICTQLQASPLNTLYVGDSLIRDIYMAKEAGLHAAWAKYGTEYSQDLWPLLVRVTHWTEADLVREKKLRDDVGQVLPDVTLTRFSDIVNLYKFKPLES